MLSTDDHFNDFRRGTEGIIGDRTQVDKDMKDMSTDDYGGTTVIRVAAMGRTGTGIIKHLIDRIYQVLTKCQIFDHFTHI